MTPEEINNLKEENQKMKDLLGEFIIETEKLEERLRISREANAGILKELDITKQQLARERMRTEKKETPEEIIRGMGWSPAKSGRYWRLFKRIDNHMYAIHHGKKLDPDKAREQIAKKEKQIGNDLQKRQAVLGSVPG